MAAGQRIVRSSLGCFGSTYAEDGFIFRQTAGQSSATGSFKNDALMLRQGFQQPFNQNITSEDSRGLKFSMFPNPAKSSTLISFNEEVVECVVAVRDLNGTVVSEFRIENVMIISLDINGLKPGIYIVNIKGRNASGSEKLIVIR